MTSTGTDQKAYQMTMSKGDSRYEVSPKRLLFAEKGTELRISPLLEGIRTLSGEKIQWYLASELRDRIRDSKARVTVIDKLARKQYEVEPRQFEGRLLHQLPAIRTVFGDAYAELYLAEPTDSARVALTRVGTRVIEDISTLPGLEHAPWVSRYVQGLIDVPFLNLTPGTRNGIIQDERYAALIDALAPLESHVKGLIEEQQRAEEEQASQQSLKAIQRAFHEAMLALPREEYDWFDVQGRARQEGAGTGANTGGLPMRNRLAGGVAGRGGAGPQRLAAAPVLRLRRPPLWCRRLAGREYRSRSMRPQVPRPATGSFPPARNRRLGFAWKITEGDGTVEGATDQEVEYRAPAAPGLARLKVTVTQRDVAVTAEALDHGHRQPGERHGARRGQYARITRLHVRTGGRRALALPLRCRAQHHRRQQRASRFRIRNPQSSAAAALPSALYVKELVLKNFAGLAADQLLERMIELSLYAEEKLKSG